MQLLSQQRIGPVLLPQAFHGCTAGRHARSCCVSAPQKQHRLKPNTLQPFSVRGTDTKIAKQQARHCCIAQARRSRGFDARDQDRDELEPTPQQHQLESLKLRQSLRNSVQDAVESLGPRVTVGDVAARAGVKISEAEEALNALAADSAGSLEVSDAGDILYVLPSNFKQVIAGKSWLLRAEPFLQKVRDASAYLVRVTFGTALITSVVLVWLTILAILSSSNRDDDRRRNNNSYGYGGGMGPRIWFSPLDIFWYWDPYFMRRRRMQRQAGQGMNFLEAIFSFVFGDGNPNETYEDRRWRLVGNYIQHKGGVVTAEELAPYMDVPQAGKDPESLNSDESYVMPALVRFNGSAEVDKNNNIIYRFPTLQKTGRRQAAPTPSERVALEQQWKLTEATDGQQAKAVALGLANLVGVIVLGNFLSDPQVLYSLANSSLSFMIGLFPLLQAYAASFFVIPLVRWVIIQGRNRNIQQRNEVRQATASAVLNPDRRLRAKLESAQKQGERTFISDRDIVYNSDKDFTDQNLDYDGESFDKRLAALDRQAAIDSNNRGGQSPPKKKAYDW